MNEIGAEWQLQRWRMVEISQQGGETLAPQETQNCTELTLMLARIRLLHRRWPRPLILETRKIRTDPVCGNNLPLTQGIGNCRWMLR